MKLSALLLLCVLPALPGTARTFTSSDGEHIEAEIAKASGEAVTLRCHEGELLTLPLSQLSEADREFVKSWRVEKLPQLHVTPHFSQSDHGPGSTPTHQVLDLSVDLASESGDPEVEAEIKYILIGEDMEKEDRCKVLSIQTAPFLIAPDKPATLKFKTVKNYYQSDQGKRKGARCIGYVLHASRKSDGRTFFATASTPELEKAIEAIITLKTGEETDRNFLPVSAQYLGQSDETRAVTAQ